MLNWVVGNLNSDICIVFILDGLTQDCSTQSGNALLTVNENFLTNGTIAIFKLYIGTLPSDNISDWETIVKAIN